MFKLLAKLFKRKPYGNQDMNDEPPEGYGPFLCQRLAELGLGAEKANEASAGQ
jgi:hypothetical protein